MNESAQTVAIIFSKDRAMQLDACLRSFSLHCRDVPVCRQRVIYTCTTEKHESQYATLREVYKEVEFVRERSFHDDLVREISGFSHVLFIVDDNIYVRPWAISEVLEALQQNTHSIGFSLRLGRNTTFCYPHNAPQKVPEFEHVSSRIIRFNWTGAQYDFGYPFEISSSVYRVPEVMSLITRSSEAKSPNRLEVVLDRTKQVFLRSHPELLCFDTSVAFCNPANIVQPICLNRYGAKSLYSTYSLSRKFELGYRINLGPLMNFVPNACHQEVVFQFLSPDSASGVIMSTVDIREETKPESKKTEVSNGSPFQGNLSLSCTCELSQMDGEELEVVLNFIKMLKKSQSSEGRIPWLIQVLQNLQTEKIEEIEEVNRVLKVFQDRLSEVTGQYFELQQAYNLLSRRFGETEPNAEVQDQSLKVSYRDAKDEKNKLQGELYQVVNSRCYKLANIFRDARYSRKQCLLLPLRLTWFVLPFRVKSHVKTISRGVDRRFFTLRLKTKRIWEIVWSKGLPKISVVIPCYNYGQYLPEAIDSILCQTWQDFEIIVVDDGSDDPDTVNILNQLKKPKTRIIRQRNLKLPAARNRGIADSKGMYICCLDADDKIAPTFLEKCVQRLENEGLDICGSWQQNFEDDNSVLAPGRFSIKTLLECNCMINAALFRRSLWCKIGGYDERMTDGYEDWEFWIRMAAAGAKADVVTEPLFLYRKHGPSMIDSTVQKHDKIVEWIRLKHATLLKTSSQPAATPNAVRQASKS